VILWTVTAECVDSNIWKLTTEHARSHGRDVFDANRDMYLAAIEEREMSIAEKKMSAHLHLGKKAHGVTKIFSSRT